MLYKINLDQDSKEQHNINKQDIKSLVPHHHIANGIPNFKRLLVAYDGTEISTRALEYASYISNIANSEIVIINVIEDNGDLDKVLPLTIKINLKEATTKVEKEEIDQVKRYLSEVVLDETLQKIVTEIST